MIRWHVPSEESPIEILDRVPSYTIARLHTIGIHTVCQLRGAHSSVLVSAGLSDFELHACRVALAKFRPPTPPNRAA